MARYETFTATIVMVSDDLDTDRREVFAMLRDQAMDVQYVGPDGQLWAVHMLKEDS
jgi:hypothetical protein